MKNRLMPMIILSALALSGANANAYCLNGLDEGDGDTITWAYDYDSLIAYNGAYTPGVDAHFTALWPRTFSATDTWNKAAGLATTLERATALWWSSSWGTPRPDVIVEVSSIDSCEPLTAYDLQYGDGWLGRTVQIGDETTIELNGCAFRSMDNPSALPLEIDFDSVLVQQFGHVLGLSHSDDGCSSPTVGPGVMHSGGPFFPSGTWVWLRYDDIMGLRDAHGTRVRDITRTSGFQPTQLTTGVVLPGGQTLSQVSASVTPSMADDNHLAAFVGPDNQARAFNFGLYNQPTSYAGDIVHSLGETYQTPVAAVGGGYEMVAWYGLQSMGFDLLIVATRETGGQWTTTWVPAFPQGLGGAAYHEGMGRFVISLPVRDRAAIGTIDPVSNTADFNPVEDGMSVRHVGPPLINSDGRLLVPVARKGEMQTIQVIEFATTHPVTSLGNASAFSTGQWGGGTITGVTDPRGIYETTIFSPMLPLLYSHTLVQGFAGNGPGDVAVQPGGPVGYTPYNPSDPQPYESLSGTISAGAGTYSFLSTYLFYFTYFPTGGTLL